ncbi:four helix bundle protein [Empedobacter falsenii]
MPRTEDYGLTSQIRRSAESISANIAEGFGKSSINDKVRFYEIAKGSAFETKSHLIYGQKVGYFKEDSINHLFKELNVIIFEINKLKKALKK